MSHLKGIAFESEESQLRKLRERLRQMSNATTSSACRVETTASERISRLAGRASRLSQDSICSQGTIVMLLRVPDRSVLL